MASRFLVPILSCIWIVILVFLLTVPASTEEELAARKSERVKEIEEARKQHHQYQADFLVRNVIYVVDPRTGICFAFFREQGFASVDIKKVPPHLRVVANVSSGKGPTTLPAEAPVTEPEGK